MRARKQIAVMGSFLVNPQSAEYAKAEELGYLLAKAGFDVICGGHGGIAHPLASGVTRGGGAVKGITLTESRFPRRSAKAIPRLSDVVSVDSVAARMETMASADGYVVFTGGIGTLAEFAFIWHWLQIEADFQRPAIFISRAWEHVLAAIRKDLMVKYKYYRHIYVCEEAREAVAILTRDFSMMYDEPGKIFFKEGVLFDAEGTIVESLEEEFIQSCESMGYFFRLADVMEAFDEAGCSGANPDHYTKILKRLGMEGRAAKEVGKEVRGKLKQIPRLYHDVVEVVRHLKDNGFLTGILSSRRPLRLKEIVSAHDLWGFFDLVGAECFGHGSEAAGLRREAAVWVGTHFPRNLDGAAGFDSILLDRHLSHMHAEGALTIRTLQELKHAIRHPHRPG